MLRYCVWPDPRVSFNCWLTWLRAPATLFSTPSGYLMNPARAATHWHPTTSRFRVDMMYVRGLLTVLTQKGWYCRYSLNCSVMANLNVRNSSFEEWYLDSLPFRPWLTQVTGWYFLSSAPSLYHGASVLSKKGFWNSAKVRRTRAIMHHILTLWMWLKLLGVALQGSSSQFLTSSPYPVPCLHQIVYAPSNWSQYRRSCSWMASVSIHGVGISVVQYRVR